jgi:glycosyltransferase involved in cell wall biosynthesis
VTPGVSVVIPCFNQADYLGEAIESVLAQRSPVQEIVVIDDGSTDASLATAKRYGPTVRTVSRPHQGIAATRNLGVGQCSGDFVAWLDADDVWTPESLTARFEVLVREPAVDIAWGRTVEFFEPGVDVDDTRVAAGARAAPIAGAMLMRRAVFAKVGVFDERLTLGETIEWCRRAVDAGIVFQEVAAVTLRRRIHHANTTRHIAGHVDYLRIVRDALTHRRSIAAPNG